MNDIQKLLNAYNALEDEMKQFSRLAGDVLHSIEAREFVSEKINTDMMQCIMEFNKRQKEVLKLYQSSGLGDTVPKKMQEMRDQIEQGLADREQLDYLEAVRKSFRSLYTEDPEVDKALQKFKDKVDTIKVEKYPLDKCLVYIRPFAVFLTVIKSNDPEKTVELVPILMDYFGSKLVAHVTMSKDIYIGDEATEFTMEEEIPEDSADQAELPEDKKVNPVKEAESETVTEESATAIAQADKAETVAAGTDEVEAEKPEAVAAEADEAEAEKPETVAVQEEEPEAVVAEAADSEQEEEASPEEPVSTNAIEDNDMLLNLLASDAEKQEEEDEKFEQYLKEQKKVEKREAELMQADVKPTELDPDALGTIELEPLEPEIKEEDLPEANVITFEDIQEVSRPAKPTKPKKVDLKALLEEDNFSESKLNDPELEDMNTGRKKKRRGGKKDSGGFLNPKGIMGGF